MCQNYTWIFFSCLTLLLGAWMPLVNVSPLSGKVRELMIRSWPPNIAFLPPQQSSENQNPKRNTAAHARISALSVCSAHFALTLSPSFPFLLVSCDALFDTRTSFFFVWITLLDALYSLLCIQLLAATASLLLLLEICTHTNRVKHADA